ncbi:Os01g0344620 [Oryza sativa Japonica Group]|uniref:Os01g0344620 protein n=1 Tax=Oryza sativa subsp. japonica TaxID=39947 RepID=A0A0P0V286_ORYSJ|nr:hypothetical protein EE612_002405 [Oryza sativa]BAS71995.1 Os01g0344620 [Oryza sativa Japonica Group]
MSNNVPTMLSNTFFSRCMMSMACRTSRSFQYGRYLKNMECFLNGRGSLSSSFILSSSFFLSSGFLVFSGFLRFVPFDGFLLTFPNSQIIFSVIATTFSPDVGFLCRITLFGAIELRLHLAVLVICA